MNVVLVRRVLGFCIGLILCTACQYNPEQAEARALASGQEALDRREYKAAAIYFKKAAKLRPGNAETYYKLAIASIGLRDVSQTVNALEKVLELNPKHIQAQLKLAELMANSGDKKLVEEAEQKLHAVLAVAPDHMDALELLALIEIQTDRIDVAEQRLTSALKTSPAKPGIAALLADLRLRSGDSRRAEDVLKSAAESNPDSADAYVALARFHRAKGNFVMARQNIDAALRVDERHAPALIESAMLFLHNHEAQPAEAALRRAAESDNTSWNVVWAAYLMRSGRYEESLTELRRLYNQNPEQRDARTRLVLASLILGRSADAEQILENAIARNSTDVDALLGRVELSLRSGRLEAADADLRRAISLQPESAAAHYLFGRVYRARADRPKEREHLAEALRLDQAMLSARVRLSQNLASVGDLTGSLDIVDKAPAEQREILPLILQRNWVLLALNRNQEASTGIRRALSQGQVPEAHLQLASLHMNQKSWAAARGQIDRFLHGSAPNRQAIEMLRVCDRSAGRADATLATLRQLAERKPPSAMVLFELGRELQKHNDSAGAERAFAASLEIKKDYTPAELELAALEARLGRPAGARGRLNEVLKREPANVQVLLLSAVIDQESAMPRDAIAKYERVLKIDPDNAAALNNIAMLLADDETKKHEALRYAERAKELSPLDPRIDDTLGWVYYKRGLFTRSRDYFAGAVKASPTPLRKYHLALAYARTGDQRRAEKLVAELVAEDPRLKERWQAEVAAK